MSGVFFGWDIGGAHLKIAKLGGSGEILAVRQIACPLWRGVGELSRACALLDFPIDEPGAVHAITMTGELCDIFPDRVSGVRAIIAQLTRHVNNAASVRIFAGYEGWLDLQQATGEKAIAVASANWLALGAFTAELIGDGVLIDIGSTTTDIIPITNGEVRCLGRDDASRLSWEELVYTGIVRTPVISVCSSVPLRGRRQPLVAEVFATMSDVYRLLGNISERHDLMPTADGRGKDLASSAQRLSRMLGLDLESEHDLAEIGGVASYIAAQQRHRIENALDLVLSRDPGSGHNTTLVGAGAGAFVVEMIARNRKVNFRAFDTLVGGDSSVAESIVTAAPAVAAAKLAWMTV